MTSPNDTTITVRASRARYGGLVLFKIPGGCLFQALVRCTDSR